MAATATLSEAQEKTDVTLRAAPAARSTLIGRDDSRQPVVSNFKGSRKGGPRSHSTAAVIIRQRATCLAHRASDRILRICCGDDGISDLGYPRF